jgi:hypothetical protein
MSTKASPLAVPLTISKFWKNRRRNESVHVTLSEYEGHDLINVRVYSTGDDGIDRPTTKGVSMAVDKLPALAAGLAKAEAKARELGLLDDASSDA